MGRHYVAPCPTGGTDPLASQGGLALINNATELVATNPGSDTVSLFKVHGAGVHPASKKAISSPDHTCWFEVQDWSPVGSRKVTMKA